MITKRKVPLGDMAFDKRRKVEGCNHLQPCNNCRKLYCPHCRDVTGWKVLDDENASDYCEKCWKNMTKGNGRELGEIQS